MYSGSYDGGCTFLTLERKLTLPASERSPPLCTCCKGGFVVFVWVPCCPDSAPDDRDNVAAVSTDIGVTFSSLELSCQRWTRRRRLLRAAKEKSKHRASTIWFRSRRRVEESGQGKEEEKSREKNIWWTKRQKIYYARQPVDEQKTRKLETSSVEASDRRRQNRQE